MSKKHIFFFLLSVTLIATCVLNQAVNLAIFGTGYVFIMFIHTITTTMGIEFHSHHTNHTFPPPSISICL